MKPPIAFTATHIIQTETGFASLIVTVLETDGVLAINHRMNGELSSAFDAMKLLTDAVVDLAKKPSGKCTVSPTKGQNNGG